MPAGFEPPLELVTPRFRLVPLGRGAQPSPTTPRGRRASGTSPRRPGSRATTGRRRAACRSSATARTSPATRATSPTARGFTYTVLAPASDEVIGCVYIYPLRGGRHETPAGADPAAADVARRGGEPGGAAQVRSWVRADVAELDAELAGAVTPLARRALAVRARRVRAALIAGPARGRRARGVGERVRRARRRRRASWASGGVRARQSAPSTASPTTATAAASTSASVTATLTAPSTATRAARRPRCVSDTGMRRSIANCDAAPASPRP